MHIYYRNIFLKKMQLNKLTQLKFLTLLSLMAFQSCLFIEERWQIWDIFYTPHYKLALPNASMQWLLLKNNLN